MSVNRVTCTGWSQPSDRASIADPNGEFGDLFVDLATFLHQGGDLVIGMDDSGVIATPELPGDRRVGEVGQASGTDTSRSGGRSQGDDACSRCRAPRW